MPPSKDIKLYSKWVLFKKKEDIPKTKKGHILEIKLDFKELVANNNTWEKSCNI